MTFSSSLAQRGWKECKLGDVVCINYGKGLPALKRKLGNIPVFSSAGITGLHDTPLVYNKGIIIGRKGTIGTVYYSDQPFFCIDTAYYIESNESKYNLRFLFYLLNSLGLKDLNEDSAVPGLNRNTVYDQDILLPSLPEQRAIAGVLSSLDDKIDLLHRQNKTLEGIAESLWRKMFVEDADPNWKKGTLSEFGRIVCGKTPSKKNSEYFDGRVPFIKIPDMHGNVFIFDTEDLLTEEGRTSQDNKTIPARSVCVSCIATVGLVGMNAIDSQTNQQINTIIPNEEYQRYYLFLLMRSMTDDLYARASGGTATDNLNTGDFSRIEVSRAPESIIKNFDGIVKNYFEKIYANQLQIRTLSRLRDTLLPKLMSRELKVQA